jgi:hypothetical protein
MVWHFSLFFIFRHCEKYFISGIHPYRLSVTFELHPSACYPYLICTNYRFCYQNINCRQLVHFICVCVLQGDCYGRSWIMVQGWWTPKSWVMWGWPEEWIWPAWPWFSLLCLRWCSVWGIGLMYNQLIHAPS